MFGIIASSYITGYIIVMWAKWLDNRHLRLLDIPDAMLWPIGIPYRTIMILLGK